VHTVSIHEDMGTVHTVVALHAGASVLCRDARLAGVACWGL